MLKINIVNNQLIDDTTSYNWFVRFAEKVSAEIEPLLSGTKYRLLYASEKKGKGKTRTGGWRKVIAKNTQDKVFFELWYDRYSSLDALRIYYCFVHSEKEYTSTSKIYKIRDFTAPYYPLDSERSLDHVADETSSSDSVRVHLTVPLLPEELGNPLLCQHEPSDLQYGIYEEKIPPFSEDHESSILREIIKFFSLGIAAAYGSSSHLSNGPATITLDQNGPIALQPDSKMKKAIETYAMEKAIEHYTNLGWVVKDVSAKKSYDLECENGEQKLFVEVKGLTRLKSSILVTPHELEIAEDYHPNVDLYILHSFRLTPTVDNPYKFEGGECQIIKSWSPKEGTSITRQIEWYLPGIEVPQRKPRI